MVLVGEKQASATKKLIKANINNINPLRQTKPWNVLDQFETQKRVEKYKRHYEAKGKNLKEDKFGCFKKAEGRSLHDKHPS